MHVAKSQNRIILNHLIKHKTITPLEALGLYGVFRLGARVFDLRKEGVNVRMTLKKDPNGKRYASYSIPAGK